MTTRNKTILLLFAAGIIGVAVFFYAHHAHHHAHHTDHADDHAAGDDVVIPVGNLVLKNPRINAPPPEAKAFGGYLTIVNNAADDDTLLSATTTLAETTEIQEMKNENDIMKMRPLPLGLPLPANETTTLASGGYHLMFFDPTQKLAVGDEVPVVLTFANTPSMTVHFTIQAGDTTHKHKH